MEPYKWELDWDEFVKTGKLNFTQQLYIGHIVEGNRVEQKTPNNGFTQDRNFRKIGSIPTSVYKTHIAHLPKEEQPLAIYKLLNENPGLRTVERIKTDTPSDGHIIVK